MNIKPVIKPPSKSCPEWTRKEMILYGGTSLFYLSLIVWLLDGSFSVWYEFNYGVLKYATPFVCKLDLLLLLSCVFGMTLGMLIRPAWRGWRWVIIMSLGLAGQVIYTSLYYDAYKLDGSVAFSDVFDECVFVCMLFFAECRAFWDMFLLHDMKRRPPTTGLRYGHICRQLNIEKK